MKLRYAGKNVHVPGTADIPVYFDGIRGLIQEMINEIRPWREGEDPIHTIDLSHDIDNIVTVVNGQSQDVFWGINKDHWARNPQVSPFIDSNDTRTDIFTIEMAGTPDKPVLARAYPGEYIPPLPWMKSSRYADGGYEACVEYWKSHAYVAANVDVREGTRSNRAPSWYITIPTMPVFSHR